MIIKKFLEISYEFAFVVLLITVFFFTIGEGIENYVLDKQIIRLVDDAYDNISKVLLVTLTSDEKENIMRNIIETNKPPDEDSNKKLLINLIIVISTIILAIIILYFVFRKEYDISIKNLLLENIILFIFVGSFEYYFFTTYVTKYSPILPSEVNDVISNKFNEKITPEQQKKILTRYQEIMKIENTLSDIGVINNLGNLIDSKN